MPTGEASYLPAGRGAFAATWSFYAGLAFRRSAGAQGSNLPLVIADYLAKLSDAAAMLASERSGDSALDHVVSLS